MESKVMSLNTTIQPALTSVETTSSTATASTLTLPITSGTSESPMSIKNNVPTTLILIATASSAVTLAVICIVAMTTVCILLVAKRRKKSLKLPPSSIPLTVEKNEQIENHSRVHIQEVEEDKPNYVEGTRKRHLSPAVMMAESKDILQYDQAMLKQASSPPGPDTTTTATRSTVNEGNAKKIHPFFTVTDDDKPTAITGESSHGASSAASHRYNNVTIATEDQAMKKHSAAAATNVIRVSPIRGNRVRPVVQPYSSVTIATNFGIPMRRNEAYGSRENTDDADADDGDNATKDTEDDSNDYDDIV